MATITRSFISTWLRFGAAFLVALSTSTPALSQDQGSDDVLIEEIIVFATRRAADVQDIPIAVTAITGNDIQQAAIKDVFDLQQYAPGLVVGQSQTTTTSNFSIRGIGTSSNNFGLESSVGLYVDDVYRSRQNSLVNEMIDVEAVEVLRGPQGTLFGKNTPQGAINMRTVAPDHNDPNAFVEVTGGDYGLLRVSAASNFSLTDSTAIRATIFSSTRDGYVDEFEGGNDVFNDRDRFGARLQLAYTNNDNFDLRVIADYSELDETCCVALSRVDSLFAKFYTDAGSGFPGGAVPGSDFILFGLGGTVLTSDSYSDAEVAALNQAAINAGLLGGGRIISNTGFDAYTASVNSLPRSTSEDAGLSVKFDWDLSDSMTLTSITAYRAFDTTSTIDADFTDVLLLNRQQQAQQTSLSQELRLGGDLGDRGNWLTGFFYFDQDLDNQRQTNGEPFLGGYLSAAVPDLRLVRDGIDALNAGTGGLVPPAGEPFPFGTFADDDVSQQHQSWAVFGQVDFPIGDNFLLTVGARYTDESKDMTANFVQSAQGGVPNLDGIAVVLCSADPNCLAANPGLPPFDPTNPVSQAIIEPFTADGWGTYSFAPLSPRPNIVTSLEDDQVTGNLKLTWFATDSTMFYASYAEGYKSGGTNTDRINPAFSEIFGPETSETIELGMKADFTNINLRLNVAVYDNQIDGLQANSWTGTGFNVQNAGKADTQGAEIEAWWQPTDTLGFQAFYVRSEGTYEDFENGTCWDAYVFHSGQPDPNEPNGDRDANICPRAGGRLAYNPEDTFFLAFTKDFMIGNASTLFIRGEYSYYSEVLTDGDLDPLTELEAINIINARVGWRWDDAGTELAIWGRNLGDERYYPGSFDAPVQDGRMNSYPAEPRTWGVTFRMDF
jgi:outer membrane receptor protein involved in Fe transport